MKNKRLKILLLLLITSLSTISQNKVAVEFGRNVFGYRSQFTHQELYIRGVYEFPTNHRGYKQVGVGIKLFSNVGDFDNVSEVIVYSGYTWEDVVLDRLNLSLNGSFNLNSFNILLIPSLGVQLQISYDVVDGVSLFVNMDNVGNLERGELYPDTLNRDFLKQNISIYGGVKIDILDTRY